jgi:hypothetical protein
MDADALCPALLDEWATTSLFAQFELADFLCAGRNDQVLRVHGSDDIVRRDVALLQQPLVEIDLDLALLAAIGERDRGARDSRKLGANEIVGEIEEPLFGNGPARRPTG